RTAGLVVSGGITAIMFGGVSFAQTADVTFNGSISDSCTVVADSPGTLAVNTTNTELGSSLAGGAAGAATVTASASTYEVTVDAPSSFDTAPAGSDTNTTFATTYDASGATTATGVAGSTATALGAGVTTLAVGASATKSSGIYESGSYSLTTTVRCAAQ
ncbi:MAG: hypothetical protein AAF986_09745, partial [Pseudomonadota bacterium]